MDATCAIQNSIHVFSLVHINMCPGFWVHIKIGKQATRRLFELIGEPEETTDYECKKLDPELIIRKSCTLPKYRK